MPTGVYKRTREMYRTRYGRTPWNKGRIGIYSEETLKKMSVWQKGRKLPEETRRKISRAKIGHLVSEETKIKIGKASKGRKHTEEAKKKISEAHRGKKHSEETKRKMSESGKGRIFSLKHRRRLSEFQKKVVKEGRHLFWKGGISNKNGLIRVSMESRLWREAVFARDNWTCQKEGIVGGKLHPHHIKNFSQFPELRFAIDNGITLSEKAHKEFHKKYGIKNNTRRQLEEFLK